MITTEIRNQILDNSKPSQVWLYSSGDAGNVLYAIAKKYSLNDGATKYKIFSITIGDIILGFYKIEDTIPLLKQELEIDEATAAKLGSEVLEFLKPLSDPNWQPPAEESDRDLVTPIQDAPQEEGMSKINGRVIKNSLETTVIPEIRTMASDMANERSPVRSTFNTVADLDEPVHVSSQPSLNHTAIDVPSYNTPAIHSPSALPPTEDSRWS